MSKVLFDNIQKFDYMEPIKKLAEYYKKIKNNYYQILSKKNIKLITNNIDSEEILLKYFQCRSDIKVLILFGKDVNLDKVIKKETDFYYSKYIKFTKKELISLFYQINYGNIDKYYQLIDKIDLYNFSENNNQLSIYFYEGNINIDTKYIYLLNNTYNEGLIYSKIFLNRNSLDLLKDQNIKNIFNLNRKDKICQQQFDDYIKYFCGLNPLEKNNIMLTSSIVLYLYGLRNCGDIDGYYIENINKIDKNVIDIKKVTDKLAKYDINKHKVTFYDILLNPRYHMYFLGMKANTLDIEMRNKELRINRPRAFVDIIMVNITYNNNYRVPIMYKNWEKFKLKSTFFKTMRHIFKIKYEKNFDIDYIKNLIDKYK